MSDRNAGVGIGFWTAEKRHVLGWLVLPVFAVLNGLIRDTTYGPRMGYDASHAVSVAPLFVAIFLWAAFLARRRPLASAASALRVGAIWLALTLAFEFGLGALQGLPLSAMLSEYDVVHGKVWPLVPLATFAAPVVTRAWMDHTVGNP